MDAEDRDKRMGVWNPQVSQEILRSRPDTKVADVEGPHLLLQTAPAIAVRLVKSFVNGMTAS
jgi:hypothetical protein